MSDKIETKEKAKKEKAPKTKLGGSILTFSKSIEPSEAVMYARRHDKDGNHFDEPIKVNLQGHRGQISNGNVSEKQAPGGPNLQVVEEARMPADCDKLAVKFKVRIMPSVLKPHSALDMETMDAYAELVNLYSQIGGFKFLAALYLENLANGRFLHENRRRAEDGFVTVSGSGGVSIKFDIFKFDLNTLTGLPALKTAMVEGDEYDLNLLVDQFAHSLTNQPSYFDVEFVGTVASGLEIKPSQIYPSEEAKSTAIGKQLAKREVKFGGKVYNAAVISAQKLGALIRCIDIWHGSLDNAPVSVNPYAGHHATGKALRYRGAKDGTNKRDFFVIKDDDKFLSEQLESVETAEQLHGDVHFFFANLIRGGVFNA